MDAKEIIHEVLSHPLEKFHNFNIRLESKDQILEKLNQFCKESDYQLSIAYYDNKKIDLIEIRLIKITQPKIPVKTARLGVNLAVIVGAVVGWLILRYVW